MSIFRQAENVFNGVFHLVKNGVQSVNFQALMFIQGQFQPSHELFSKDRQQVLLLAEHCLQDWPFRYPALPVDVGTAPDFLPACGGTVIGHRAFQQ